jgi:hypothetical protein
MFTDGKLNTSQLAVACFLYSRLSSKLKRPLATSYQNISLTLGFCRPQVFNILKALTATKYIKKTAMAHNKPSLFTGVHLPEQKTVVVPKAIIRNTELKVDEKIVLICLFNRKDLKLDTKQDWAKAAGVHTRTLAKIIKELVEVNVLAQTGQKWPMLKAPNSWRVIRDSHIVRYGAEWDRRNVVIERPAPVLTLVPPIVCGVAQHTWLNLYNDNAAQFLPPMSDCA